MIAERVFLAFDTGRELAYVQASGWQRAYLLWTFRNFRGVPHKILNGRQRQLVEELYPAATPNLRRGLDQDSVIGTVEDFIAPFPAPAPVSAAAKKTVSSVSPKKLAREAAPIHSAPLHFEPVAADAQKLEREARITISFISEDVVAVSFPDAAQVSR